VLNLFRIVSLLEGVSYLLILSVTLNVIPRDLVYLFGMGHGILFMLYFVFSLLASHKHDWTVIVWLLVLLSAIIPFAFVLVEIFLKKEIRKGLTADEKNS